MGLALGKDIATDCSVNTVLNGRTYCFGNEQAKSIFLKKPEEFLTNRSIIRARAYSRKGRFCDRSRLDTSTKRAEIGDAVAFVCSGRASATNGAALRVDGGLVRSVF